MKQLSVTCAGAALAAMVCLVGSATGAPIVQQDGSPTQFADWTTSGFGSGTFLAGTTVGGTPNAAQITGNAAGLVPQSVLAYTTNSALINQITSGNALALSMDFYTFADRGINSIRLYFETDTGYFWYSDIGALTEGWGNTFTVNFVHFSSAGGDLAGYGSWYSETDRTPANFVADLADVLRIGFELDFIEDTSGTIRNQTYGFDNFGLYDTYFVPEPETYLVIAVALASLAFVFRTHIREVVRTAYATVAS